MLEKAEKVGGFARTEKINGKNYDMTTMLIPGGSFTGGGIEPALQELIDFTKEKISPAVDLYTLDTEDQFLDVIPETLQGYTPEEIVGQVLTGMGYTTQLLLCLLDSTNCASCEVCADIYLPILEWGDKWGVPAYAKLGTHLGDGLGIAPAAAISTFFSTLSSFTAVDAAELLRNLGVTPDSLPASTPSNIVSLLSKPRWYFFERGYQTFWEELVKRATIPVHTNFAVESLDKLTGGEWQVTASDGTVFEFDNVIVTTAPQDAIPFVPPEQAALLQTAVPQVPPNDVFVVKVNDINSVDTDVDNDVVGFWPTGLGMGSLSVIDPAFGGSTKPFFYLRRHERDVFVIATVTLGVSPEDAFEAVKTYSKDTLDLEITEELFHERYYFPSGPVDSLAWSSGWATLQGKDGLWFNGESFAGSGIPRITQYTKQFVAQVF